MLQIIEIKSVQAVHEGLENAQHDTFHCSTASRFRQIQFANWATIFVEKAIKEIISEFHIQPFRSWVERRIYDLSIDSKLSKENFRILSSGNELSRTRSPGKQ